MVQTEYNKINKKEKFSLVLRFTVDETDDGASTLANQTFFSQEEMCDKHYNPFVELNETMEDSESLPNLKLVEASVVDWVLILIEWMWELLEKFAWESVPKNENATDENSRPIYADFARKIVEDGIKVFSFYGHPSVPDHLKNVYGISILLSGETGRVSVSGTHSRVIRDAVSLFNGVSCDFEKTKEWYTEASLIKVSRMNLSLVLVT